MGTIRDNGYMVLEVTPERYGLELRLAAAVKLYELGRLSSGAAAKLAGIPRFEQTGGLWCRYVSSEL